MEKRVLTRAMVESIVARGIRDVAVDPARSLRKLVDLGDLFAKGRFQKHHFEVFQRMLADETSPYYEMVRRTIEQVDSQALETFGLNVGWESWTVGAEHIRTLEAQRHYNIPWCLTLRLGGHPWAFGPEQYRDLLRQGRELGIRVYFFFADDPTADPSVLTKLSAEEPGCAFVLFLSPASLTAPLLEELRRCPNVMTVLDTAGDWQGAAAHLEKAKCLMGLYRTFRSEQEGDEITSGRWLASLGDPVGPMVFCVAGRECPTPVREQVRAYVLNAREKQHYPLVPVEYTGDLLLVDHIISNEPCYLSVAPDGTVCGSRSGREVVLDASLRTDSLAGVLSRFFPWES